MIDWARIDELIAEIGAEDFEEVVELFLEEVDAAMASLNRVGGDTSSDRTLHLIKGCAWNLGFAQLGTRCAEIEREGGHLDAGTAQDLRDVYDASRDDLQNGLIARAIATPAA